MTVSFLSGTTAGASTFTMTIQTPKPSKTSRLGVSGMLAASFVFPLLLAPVAGGGEKKRRRAKLARYMVIGLLVIAISGATIVMGGCGSGSGFFAQSSAKYVITVVGTYTTPTGATAQRFATVNLTII